MPRLPLLLALLLVLPACTSAERAARDVADTTADVATDAANAVADVASAAYNGARDVLGVERVPDDARVAVARITAPADTSTGVTGTVTFVELTDGVYVDYDLRGLRPGAHGFHVHAGTSCGARDTDDDGVAEAGGAAGGHFNPMTTPHGAPSDDADERHAGDLGNITAGSNGQANDDLEDPVLSFDGATNPVGHAVVIHGGRDDLTSQPSGAAGGRVGCGVIRLVPRDRM